MKTHARWLAGLLAGLGLVGRGWADPADSDPVPIRRLDSLRADGTRQTVIEILPTTQVEGPPTELPPADHPDPPAPPVPPTPVRPTPIPPAAPVPPTVVGVEPMFVPGFGPNLWAEVDYIQWWYRGGFLPPLVTAGSPSDPIPGALGQPGTRVLYGGGPVDSEWSPGGRARLGGFFGGAPVGWEVGGFYTVPQEAIGVFGSGAVPVLARPFFDTFLATPASLLFGAPGAFEGLIATRTRTSFWGLEANGVAALEPDGSLIGFAGYRYLQMTDEVAVGGRYTLGPGGLAFVNGLGLLTGATGTIEDRVRARNEFHGAQVGGRYRGEYGPFGVEVRASVAVGLGTERVNLEGSTQTVDADGTRRTAPAGLLVQPSNAGQYGRDRLTVVPEVGTRVFVRVSPNVCLHAGYDFIYWASVARAGDQLDYAVDTRQAPFSGNFTGGPGFRPISPVRDTAFWAHGFNVGVRLEY